MKHKEQIDILKREFDEKLKEIARKQQPKEVATIAEAEEPTSTTSSTLNRELEENKNLATSKEMEVQKRTQEGELSSQKREDNSPLIVKITNENIDRVSKKDHGMLRNHDGSYLRTPQYETWKKNQHLQLRNETESAPDLPVELTETPNHPLPTNLEQIWSYGGEWVMVPKYTSDQGSF